VKLKGEVALQNRLSEPSKRYKRIDILCWGRFAMTEDMQRLFAGVRDFGWNPKKRESNLRDHRIDFEDVRGILDGYTFIRRSDRHGEVRYQIFGYVEGREIAVACTFRGALCWIISARRARRDERKKYYNRFKGLPEEGKD
jgi:uncharacterized protein